MCTGNELLDYCNQELEKFMDELKSGEIFEHEYDPELIKLAEEIIKNNPDAFKNFL